MAVGRPRKFRRDEVLAKAIPVFWQHGFAATSLVDLEKANGVNWSDLYAEFKGEEDLFLAAMKHYLHTSGLAQLLAGEPSGWGNVSGISSSGSLKAHPAAPHQEHRRRETQATPAALADMVMSAFFGISIEANLASGRARGLRKIKTLLRVLVHS